MEGIYEALQRNRDSGRCPMHMPGHKRDVEQFQMDNPYGLDITEIHGFDDLHDADGLLRAAMERAADLYGAGRTWFLVNGSSCGVLAAVGACVHAGDEVLVARNSHKSLYNALYQNSLTPHYLCPSFLPGFGAAAGVEPQAVEAALQAHPQVKLVAVTSPTYEGVVSDIAAIAAVCHAHGVPLLVDEAHGAHLGLAEGFPGNAVQAGADLVVQSVHKTLPSLTQTALLHWNGDRVSPQRIERQLSIYESSSPSYILMASIDRCVSFLRQQGGSAFAAYRQRLAGFRQAAAGLSRLRLLGQEAVGEKGVFALDPSKIVISTRFVGMTGPEMAASLREKDNIELEMAARDYAIAMTSLCDSEENFHRLAQALLRADREAPPQPPAEEPEPPRLPRRAMTLRAAEEAPGRLLPLEQAAGRVSREAVFAYPPGIPLIVPGEYVEEGFPALLRSYQRAGVSLKNSRRAPVDFLDTVAE